MKDAVITVRVPRELKEELKRHGIEASTVVRRALEEEIRRRRLEWFRRVAGELGRFFNEMSDEEIIESIRRIRESRWCTCFTPVP
jgi:hypothetical protein